MLDRHAMAGDAAALPFARVHQDFEALLALQKVERRLEALLAEHRASDPNELPRALQGEILRRAILERAALNFPMANLEALDHGTQSLMHPPFAPAWERMRLATKGGSDAFAMTTGVYAAVVLAGYGLPVARFDLARSCILGEPSNDIDAVLALFEPDKGAVVGYNSTAAPFYVLVTDCIRTLRQWVLTWPELAEVKKLFERYGASLPADPGQRFVPGMAVVPRRPGDTVSTVALLDPSPMAGSIALYAGWQVDGEPYGAPNDGYMPVPVQLLRAVVQDPVIAYSLSRPVGLSPAIH
jgi:hypothetical protein